MTAALLLAVPAILAIAAATPRQADQIFGRYLSQNRRLNLRIAGLCLLCLSFSITLADPDRTRVIITWAGATGIEAILIALILTLLAGRTKRPARR